MPLNGVLTDPAPMVTVACAHAECGLEYMIPRHVYEQARELGERRKLHCPNGHRWHYSLSEAHRLKKDVERLQGELARVHEYADQRGNDAVRLSKLVSYWKGQAHRRRRP